MNFNRLLEDYGNVLCKVAYIRKSQLMPTDEALQLAMIRLWEYSLNPKPKDDLKAYLCADIGGHIMNENRKYHRYRDRFVSPDPDKGDTLGDAESDAKAESMVTDREDMAFVESRLNGLSKPLRDTVRLRLRGYSLTAIAKTLRITTTTVYYRIEKATEQLKKENSHA